MLEYDVAAVGSGFFSCFPAFWLMNTRFESISSSSIRESFIGSSLIGFILCKERVIVDRSPTQTSQKSDMVRVVKVLSLKVH
jgi:hypothetical protein